MGCGDSETPRAGETPTETDVSEAAATTEPLPEATRSGAPTAPSPNFRFLISDTPNAIDDFESLLVTIDEIGVLRGGESGSWVRWGVSAPPVDLIAVQGELAQEILTATLDEGSYSKVFIYIGNVEGVLTDGDSVEVKLPSNKLQLRQGFEIAPGSVISFVYDLTVKAAGKKAGRIKYLLLPQIGESRPDQAFVEVEGAGGDLEEQLNLGLTGDLQAGRMVTLTVTFGEELVDGATVTVNGENAGTTEQGQLTFQLSDAEEWEIRATQDGLESELTVETSIPPELGESLDLSVPESIGAGEEVTLTVLFEGQEVVDAMVSVNGEAVDITDESGQVTFMVPEDAAELIVEAVSGDLVGSVTVAIGVAP